MASKVQALRLTLGNAPNTWHSVDGLIGWFHPSVPAPVGGDGEPSVEDAKAAHKHGGTAVELVQITEEEAAKARRLLEDVRQHAKRAITIARAVGDEHSEKVHAEVAAVTGEHPESPDGEEQMNG